MVDEIAEKENELNYKNGFIHDIKNHKSKTDQGPKETQCGLGCFHPKWLQIFTSKKAFVIVYSFAGMQQFIVACYYVGIMSTMEKSFNMSSQQSGLISAAWDIGSLFTNVVISYIAGKGHRTRWVAAGTFLLALSSFMKILPYYIYGSGDVIKMYTKEYSNISDVMEMTKSNTTGLKRLSTNITCHNDDNYRKDTDTSIFYITFFSQVVMGIGTAVYWTCGATYLDDNVRKNILPALLAIVQSIRLFGPTVGFLLSSYALKIYVEPSLTPFIDQEDPRWVGAWWIGWYPIGCASLILAFLLCLFPKSLPRAAARKQNVIQKHPGVSISDFKETMTRLRKNKILIFNSLSSTFFALSMMAYWNFMPKYMESQFSLSASKSNFLTGTVSILCNALGVMTAGLVISKLRPSARSLAGWNVFVESLDIIGRVSFSFISCPQQNYHGHWNTDRSLNLTETCNADLGCGTDIQYAPVCDIQTGLAYYSSCHAGCNASSIIDGVTEYLDCSCVSGTKKVIDGVCPKDCSSNIFLFISIMGFLSFTSATGRSANTLIQFRSVEERDKSLSIGVTEALMSLFAFIPAPIFYGLLMDWTCIVWGNNCGEKGNCWLYDSQRLRYAFNLTASGFMFLGTLLDCFVWYYVKGLKLYDEDLTNVDDNIKPKTPIVKNTTNSSNLDTELPLMKIQSLGT